MRIGGSLACVLLGWISAGEFDTGCGDELLWFVWGEGQWWRGYGAAEELELGLGLQSV